MTFFMCTLHTCRYTEAIMSNSTRARFGQNSTSPVNPVSATGYGEGLTVVVTSKKDYYLEQRRESVNFMLPVQETCQFSSAKTVFE